LSRHSKAALLGLFLLAIATPVRAVEFQLDGYDRTFFRLFNDLSLDRDADQAEGTRSYFEQRLRLNPHLEINPHIHVFGQIDVLDLALYGSGSEVLLSTGFEDLAGSAYDEPVQLSQSVIPGEDYRGNSVVRRAWGEIWTPHIDLRFGRMGNHWGSGVLANDGNDPLAYYGDTVDRVQLLGRIGPIQLTLSFDTFLEGWINHDDDIWGITFAGGFISDVHSAGVYMHWRRMASEDWTAFYADLWGRTRLGPLSFELEAALVYGKGNATDLGIEDMELLAGGGAFTAGIEVLPIGGAFQLGVASGDSDPTDATLNTFSFDRDFDVALLMFQEPMPVFRHLDPGPENNGIDDSFVIQGDTMSNAVYIKPSFFFDPLDNLRLTLNFIAAGRVAVSEPDLSAEEKHLGLELDFDARWTLYENFELGATVGVLFPGTQFEPYTDTVVGTELRGIIRF